MPAAPAEASTANHSAGIGYYQASNSSWHISNDIPPGGASDTAFVAGPPNTGGIVPIAGDWDGNGSTSIGYYQYSNASWHLYNDLNGGASDIAFVWGPVGNTDIQPVVGDWNGDGKDTVGWYRPSDGSWHLAASNTTSTSSSAFVWGLAGDTSVSAVAGDWNGDGKDTVGWYHPSDGSWHLANSLSASTSTIAFVNGPAGDTSVKAVVGDWNGSGTDGVGWYRPSNASFHLTNSLAHTSSSDYAFTDGPAGNSSITPITGDWDGSSAPYTSAQVVAQRLVVDYKAGTLRFGPDNPAATYQQEILAVAQNGSASPGCRVDTRILEVIAMTVEHFGSATVGDLQRPCVGDSNNCDVSLHCYDPGLAADFQVLGGTTLNGSGAKDIALLRYWDTIVPNGSQVGQVQCRSAAGDSISLTNIRQPFPDSCNHDHFDLGASTGSVKYTP